MWSSCETKERKQFRVRSVRQNLTNAADVIVLLLHIDRSWWTRGVWEPGQVEVVNVDAVKDSPITPNANQSGDSNTIEK